MECARRVPVTNAHPGSLLHVVYADTGEPMSDHVLATSAGQVIRTWFPLQQGRDVAVVQLGCNAERHISPSERAAPSVAAAGPADRGAGSALGPGRSRPRLYSRGSPAPSRQRGSTKQYRHAQRGCADSGGAPRAARATGVVGRPDSLRRLEPDRRQADAGYARPHECDREPRDGRARKHGQRDGLGDRRGHRSAHQRSAGLARWEARGPDRGCLPVQAGHGSAEPRWSGQGTGAHVDQGFTITLKDPPPRPKGRLFLNIAPTQLVPNTLRLVSATWTVATLWTPVQTFTTSGANTSVTLPDAPASAPDNAYRSGSPRRGKLPGPSTGSAFRTSSSPGTSTPTRHCSHGKQGPDGGLVGPVGHPLGRDGNALLMVVANFQSAT